MKKLTRNGLHPAVLRRIGSDMYDYAAEGYRILERKFPDVKKWPDNANEARLLAIEAFYDGMTHGRRIEEITKTGRQKYARVELQEMADSMTYILNDAINLIVAQGAPLLLLEDNEDNNDQQNESM